MKVAKFIFVVIAIAYLAVDGLTDSGLTYFLKPAIIFSLLVYYWLTLGKNANIPMLIALLFSISGDFWLMFSGTNYFLFGLGSFLITHLCYILVFRKNSNETTIKPMTIIPFGAILGLLLLYLWPGLGEFKIPVIIYASTIMTMGYMAFTLKEKVSTKTWTFIFGGSVLFIISDSLIALGKFKSEELQIPNVHFWIMITYILAQYLIVEGIISNSLWRKNQIN